MHLLLELSAARRLGAGEDDDADVCARCREYLHKKNCQYRNDVKKIFFRRS